MIRTTSPNPEIVREVSDRVLADPAYEDSVREIVLSKDLLETLGPYLRKIVDFIGRLVGGLAELSVNQPLLFWLIMALLIAVLALILWHLAYSLSLLFRGSRSSSSERPEETGRVLRFSELWAQAHRLGDSGEYGEAIRHLLLALLARAHDQRVLLPAGWTNREIVAHLSREDLFRRQSSGISLGGALRTFVATFDRVWYGQQAAAETDFIRCKELVSVCVERFEERGDDVGRGRVIEN